MREKKFRQAIYFNGKLAEFHYWGFLKNDNNFISPQCNNQDAFKNSDEFTGLKDKNGVDIYEGDICKLQYWTPSICEVLFDRGGFCFRHSNKDSYYHDCKYLEGSIVIGNVHENAELLR